MGGMKVSELDFLRLLPAFMRDDEAAIALSKAMNKLISEPGSRIPSIRTWDEIDNMSEAELDELAWELDVDWYDSTGMSLEEKRETLKLAQQIKRKRGTKWAVERLISAYFGEGYVMEWYGNVRHPVHLRGPDYQHPHRRPQLREVRGGRQSSKERTLAPRGRFLFLAAGPGSRH